MRSHNQQQFETFISKLQPQQFYKKAISQQSKLFEVTLHQLLKLNPAEAAKLREFIFTKSREDQELREKMKQDWVQPEKRLFTWVLLCYLELHHKTANSLSQQDLQFLSDITTQKSIPLVKYMVYSLMPQEKRPVWSTSQDALLAKILAQEKKYSTVGEWSNVSKQLFLRGDHTTHKSGKNCRERWFNHVNPQLNKEWTSDQDFKLFSFVRKEGKKWSKIIPELQNTKSQHMIKNRFNSQIKKMQTELGHRTKESELINKFIQELNKKKQKHLEQTKDIVHNSSTDIGSRRLLRSGSIKNQNNSKLEQSLLISKNMEVEESEMLQNMEEDPLKFLIENNIIREDPDKQEKTDKNTCDFKLNESMRFHLTSPTPPTPFSFSTPKCDQSVTQCSFSSFAKFFNPKQR